MAVEMVRLDGVDLCVETLGERGAPPILLIAGAAESMEGWDRDLCRLLAGEGRFVIRYDHRDTGRSTSWPPGAPGYTGRDLVAGSVVGVEVRVLEPGEAVTVPWIHPDWPGPSCRGVATGAGTPAVRNQPTRSVCGRRRAVQLGQARGGGCR